VLDAISSIFLLQCQDHLITDSEEENILAIENENAIDSTAAENITDSLVLLPCGYPLRLKEQIFARVCFKTP